MIVYLRRDFTMKIDSKSLVFGILAGIVIGSVALVVLTKSLPFEFTPTEQYTVTMKIRSEYQPFYGINGTYRGDGYTLRYPYGAIAVFIKNNVTVGEYKIWYSPITNITLQKGDYTVKIYEGKSGLYSETLQIYVAKDIEIEV